METEKSVYCKDIPAWRAWLEKHHLTEKKIAVIRYKKHTGKPSPTYQELMHEAICFGWIDTTVKRLDDEKYMIRFARRTEKSKWSTNTLSYGKMLLKAGRMSDHGKQRYKEGLKKPTLDHGLEANPAMPAALEVALSKDAKAKENFEKFAPSYKRMYFRWILRAKQEETKEKRILTVVQRARENKRAWN